jgi:hypothetical protein
MPEPFPAWNGPLHVFDENSGQIILLTGPAGERQHRFMQGADDVSRRAVSGCAKSIAKPFNAKLFANFVLPFKETVRAEQQHVSPLEGNPRGRIGVEGWENSEGHSLRVYL